MERVPVNEERTGAEIGDDEVSTPVLEEEAVVGKEEVLLDDQTTTRGRGRSTDVDNETGRRGR